MSVELDEYSAVVGQVYDASLDTSAWPRTLEATCRYVGASMSALAAISPRERQYQLLVHTGYEPGWIDLYNQKYAALNPLNQAMNGMGVGDLTSLSESGLIGAYEGHPMYEEWVKPQGIHDIAEIVLDRSIDHIGSLAYTRVEADGVFTGEAMERIRLLFPHMRRSVLISRVLKLHRRGEAELADVIGALAAGVFMLSATGALLRANASGEAMLSRHGMVSHGSGRLKLSDATADRALVDALHRAQIGAAALGGSGASIPLRDADGKAYVAHLLPLSAATAEDDLRAQGAAVVLFVSPSHPELAGALATLAQTYGLTGAERRVALALVEIGSTPMIAETLGVSVTTVRTHLQSLFDKTGVRRQVDVVRLIQGLVSPFA